MKNIYILLLLGSMIAQGCKKPYDEKSVGDPIYSTAQLNAALNGHWVLSTALQVDEKSLTKEEVDITDFFSVDPSSILPNITFNTASNTYSADTAGVALKYFAPSGTYVFDDPDYPKNIFLLNGADTVTLPIGSNIQIKGGYLQFERAAYCGEEKVMNTKLKLVKQ